MTNPAATDLLIAALSPVIEALRIACKSPDAKQVTGCAFHAREAVSRGLDDLSFGDELDDVIARGREFIYSEARKGGMVPTF